MSYVCHMSLRLVDDCSYLGLGGGGGGGGAG